MYPYHNKIKQRIRAGELVTTYRADNYRGIGEALVLVFNTPPFLRPIRPEREAEYEPILSEWRRSRDFRRNPVNGQGCYNTGHCRAGA